MRVFPFALLALAWVVPAAGASFDPDDNSADSNDLQEITLDPGASADLVQEQKAVFADPDKQKMTLKYTMSSTEVDETQAAAIGYTFAEKLMAATRRTKTAFTFQLDAARKQVRTTESRTLTRSVDLIPFKFAYKPTEDLQLSFSAGAGFLFTDKLDRLTSVEAKERDLAFVYTLGAHYQMAVECISLGVDYTIRTGELMSDKLAHEWTPVLTIDFLKPCTTQH